MKRLLLLFLAVVPWVLDAQLTSGTFIYTRKVDFTRDVTPEMKARMGNMPSSMEHEYQLLFDGSRMLFRPSPVPESDETGGGGMFRGRGMGMAAEETYADFNARQTVSLFELGSDGYVITDSIAMPGWKLTNETKTILGHNCRKALSVRTFTRRKMVTENGQQVRKEVQDSANVEAWYAEDIPVPGAPDMAGTLPGMVLEMTLADGRIQFTAIDYRKKYEKKALAPPKGKTITRDEFKGKQEEYWKNFRGGPGMQRN